jgi:hypothetical protein
METLAFANPALLWGALAIGVPVAIHLLSKRRSRRVAFAAVEFILRSRREKVRHIRLRQLLLLLLRMAILLFLALAIARPLLQPKAAAGAPANARAATALVLDASLSMRYRLGDETLFERAQAGARELLESLPSESPVTLVVCDGRPTEAEAPNFDRVELKRRLAQAAPTFRPADVNGCMAAAARALGESPVEAKKIFVLGDLTLSSLHLEAPPPRVPAPGGEVIPEVVFIDAADGEKLRNLSITDVVVQPSAALGTRGFELAITLRNSGDEPRQNVPVSLEVGTQVVTRGFVDVPAGGTARKVLAHRFDPGTQLVTARLEPDALPEDDAWPLVMRVPRDVRALVVDGAPSAVRYRDETFFVEAALGPERTGGRIGAVLLDADAAAQRKLAEFDVVLLLNVAAPRPAFVQALRPFVESGGGLLVSMGDHVVPEEYNATLGELLPRPLHLVRTAAEPGEEGGPPPARFARIDFQHPALRTFEGAREGFDSARTYRYVLLQPDARGSERVLATWDDGAPALVEGRAGRGRVILYTSTVDRDWTDWPIRASFLPTIQQLTTYLAGALDERDPAPSRVGDRREPGLAEGAVLDRVTGPDGEPVKLVDAAIPLEKPGHYTISLRENGGTRGAPELAFAAVIEPSETDLRRTTAEELASHYGGENTRVAGGAEGALPAAGTPLWSWLLLGALAAFVAEGFLVRRG